MPGNLVDYLFKMVIVGDAGPARENIISNFCYDSFEGDYLATIGAAMHTFPRDVNGVSVKVVAWDIAGQDIFAQLRKTYYQNASLIMLTIEDTFPESIRRYCDLLKQVSQVTGRLPVLVVCGKGPDIDQDVAKSFAKEIDASYIVNDYSDQKALEASIDGMLRKVVTRSRAARTLPYLRSHGLVMDPWSLVRDCDSLLKEADHVDTVGIGALVKSGWPSVFLDIELLKEPSLARYIPQILEQRDEEMRKTWVNRRGEMFDLRYLWLTAYGFEILRSLGVKLVVSAGEFEKIASV